MSEAKFDTSLRDSQGTEVTPISRKILILTHIRIMKRPFLREIKNLQRQTAVFWYTAEYGPMVFFMTNAGITRNL